MTSHPTSFVRRVAFAVAGLVTSLLAAPTFAQYPAGSPPPPTDGQPPPPAADASALPPAAAAPDDPDLAPSPPGGIERMPGEAFWPAPYLRGLFGGSVWGAGMHGLQWPFYRKTGIGVSGDVWVDNAYEKVDRGDPNEASIKQYVQQARMVLRMTPTYTHGDWFVQGQAELVANKDQTLKQPDVADTDDLWVRTGNWNKWDIQLGRFQGWEVYHLGMGLDLNTFERQGATDINNPPPDIYGVTAGYYRPSGMGNIALHLYPMSVVRLEWLNQLGSEQGRNTLGSRPVVVLDFGMIKFKAGYEYRRQTQVDPGLKEKFTQQGGGAGVIVILKPYVEFGISAARSRVDHIDSKGDTDSPGSYTITSVGGFVNVRPFEDFLIGLGYHQTDKEDFHFDMATGKYGEFNHKQDFIALQYHLGKQLFIKAVVAYASAHLAPTFSNAAYTNTMSSGRLRLQYLF